MILLVDNFDSFVFNLARYLSELGHDTKVIRSHQISVADVRELRPEAIVISPGPCGPAQAGISVEIVRELKQETRILGVCLGHQVIGAAFGASIVRGEPVHGRVGLIHHDGRGIFQDLPSPFEAARYHSLVVTPSNLPDELEVAATLEDGTIMALRHRIFPIVGVQFHPESILTRGGHDLLANFLEHEPATQSTALSASRRRF